MSIKDRKEMNRLQNKVKQFGLSKLTDEEKNRFKILKKQLDEKAPLDAHPSLMSPPVKPIDQTPVMTSSSGDASVLDRIHAILKKAKINDDELINGVRLTDSGFQKISSKIGCSVDETKALFQSLVNKLKKENSHEKELMNELAGDSSNERFTYEADFMGNVTIRDTQEGKQIFVRGGEGSTLLNKIKTLGKDNRSIQDLLRNYAHIMENDDLHQQTLDRTGFWGAQGAGCIILAKDTNRILLAHRGRDVEQPNTWGSWGGAIDPGENPLKSVIREVKEEAGYHGEILETYPLYVFSKNSFKYYNFLIVVENEFDPTLNWENQGYRWCNFGEWPRPLHFGLSALFADKNSIDTIVHAIHESSNTLTESVNEDESFDSEIKNNQGGSFNFPWRVGSKHGNGNIRWVGRGDSMKFKLLWAADGEGDPISDVRLLKKIEEAGIAYIGQE